MKVYPVNLSYSPRISQIQQDQHNEQNENNIKNQQQQKTIIKNDRIFRRISKQLNQSIDKRRSQLNIMETQDKQNQQHENVIKEIETLNSEINDQQCWFCKEAQLSNDPFTKVCKCTGTNIIHSMCLLKLVVDKLQKDGQINQNNLNNKSFYEHFCSICKHSYESHIKYKKQLVLNVNSNNYLGVLISFICIAILITSIVISAHLFFTQNTQESQIIKNLNIAYKILIGIFCAIIMIVLLLLSFIFLYLSFVQTVLWHLELKSDLGNQKIVYFYNQKEKKFQFNYKDNPFYHELQQIQNKKTNLNTTTAKKLSLQTDIDQQITILNYQQK
ncbi:hypothetical protein ABPG74_004806 [Tetrahymena malaccensis]